jgi:hypothetical protein
MADNKTTPATTPVVETPKAAAPATPTPKVETVVPPTQPVHDPAAPVVEAAKVVTPVRPEMNQALSHKERITHFLESKKGAGKLKINDFLKSLYPVSREQNIPGFTVQPNMKKLKLDLTQLKNEGKIVFVNDSFQQLGKAFFPDTITGKTSYYDLTNLTIEVEV